MSKHFIGKIKLNALAHGYAQLITIGLQLLLVPFFLNYWGTELYADWIILTGIPTLLVLLDMGVAQASANDATMKAGSGNWLAVREILQTAFNFTLVLGVLIVILAIAANSFINWKSLLHLTLMTNEQAEIIILCMSANLFVQLLGGPIDGWFRSIEHAALGQFLLSSRRTIDLLIGIVLLPAMGQPVFFATITLLLQIVMMFIMVFVAMKNSNYPIFGISHGSWSEFLRILKPGLAYMSFPLSQMLTIQGGLQILNQFADAHTVVVFNMARTLMRMLLQLGVVANNAMRPEISRLIGQGKDKEASISIGKVSKITIVVVIFGYIVLVYWGPILTEFWSNSHIVVDRFLLAILGLHAIFNVAWFVPASFEIAGNKHGLIAVIYAASSIFAIVFWLIFKYYIPPSIGAAMLLLLPELFVFFWFFGKRFNHV